MPSRSFAPSLLLSLSLSPPSISPQPEELRPLRELLSELLRLGLSAHPTFRRAEQCRLHFTGRLETAE